MGCCSSSPHNSRVYRDPSDLDEEIVPLRYFGTYRAGSNLVPDDIQGLPSTHMQNHLAQNTNLLLYEADIDHGQAFRCIRPLTWVGCVLLLPYSLAYIAASGLSGFFSYCCCDQICCWVRKEYSTRTFFRVYPNRIVVNNPMARFPVGWLGFGSWNADAVLTHVFDRGAFGFQKVDAVSLRYLCCLWPSFGGAIARLRCQCNGPLWNRMFTDCGGWWCDEWLCTLCFCSYEYGGLAHPEEVAFACSIALQAYYEGRSITREDMDKCIQFWRDNVEEAGDPVGRKREVCCEPYTLQCFDGSRVYNMTHMKRDIPYADDNISDQTRECYRRYNEEREHQIKEYNRIRKGNHSTLCKICGCRRFFGRRGVIFCTEGCKCSNRKAGEPAPPPEYHDFDDDYDASSVLIKVLGPPPPNVVIRRWRYDAGRAEYYLETYPSENGGTLKPAIDDLDPLENEKQS